MILLDFDGTIVDLWPRYWSVFKDILNCDVPFKDYCIIKRNLKKDALVASHFGKVLPNDYFEKKSTMLEEPEYLSMDKMVLSLDFINHILESGGCILSKRRNEVSFRHQLYNLGIRGSAYIVNQGSKKAWILAQQLDLDEITIVGDSIEELEAAQLLKVDAVMVGYGLSTEADYKKTKIPYVYCHTSKDLQEELNRRINE